MTTGSDDGTTWDNALRGEDMFALHRALTVANPQGGDCVWVAGSQFDDGILYRLDSQLGTSFVVPSGVKLFGGLANGVQSLGDRDGDCVFSACNELRSVLDGEFTTNHVVTTINSQAGTLIDGFTVRYGNASGEGLTGDGGGMLVLGGNLEIKHCDFYGNRASGNGGALYVDESDAPSAANLVITKTKFSNNVAENGAPNHGGAIYSEAASLVMTNCDLSINIARGAGGGLFNAANVGSTNYTELNDVLFYSNKSATGGGAVFTTGDTGSTVSLTNCTLYTNGSDVGSGGVESAGPPETVTINSSILWLNHDAEQDPAPLNEQFAPPDITVDYSDVQYADPEEVADGTDNINEDPLFIGGGILVGRIGIDSPCLNLGDPLGVAWETDLDDGQREVLRIDMGVNEVQHGACCYDGACTERIGADCGVQYVCNVNALRDDSPTYGDCADNSEGCCYGDLNGDGIVTPADRGFVSANIGQTDDELVCLFDMNGDGIINPGDRGFVSAQIGQPCQPLPDWQDGTGCNHGVCPDTRFVAEFQGVGTTCDLDPCGGQSMMAGASESGSPGFDLDAASEGWYSVMVDAGETCLDGAAVFGVSDKEETVIDDASGGTLTSLGELLGSAGASPSPLFGAGFARRDMVLLESLSSRQESGGELCQVFPASGVTLRLEVYVWRVNEDDTIDAWSAALTDE